MHAVAQLVGGPAAGRRIVLDGGHTPLTITVPAADFGGYVEAEYFSTGGAHSTNRGANVHTYVYRLHSGEYDYGQSAEDEHREKELAAQLAKLQPVTDGRASVLHLDGPLGGRGGTAVGFGSGVSANVMWSW
ncbi:hypothetical protein [Leifsonia sp. 21MFCrub1.1]|uniref:hypothetical protein n=1 Tax=Leifsonia sp. 21MFCrub1.1 TaxID=1798223 RepID=UPI0008929B0D|nr:hypothetical protein [Leifsonia sp. 21MFCrub1.1]SEA34202.1 hypothetical protein SAMN04515680_0074 [Leifsonia sp. 21MFCrub1.1]